MSQELLKRSFRLTSSSSTSTEYDAFIAPAENCSILLKTPFVSNNSSNSQTLTIKVQKYNSGSSSYETSAQDTITISAGESTYPLILSDLCLEGHDTNPDKVVVSFDTALSGSESIDFLFTFVKFIVATSSPTPPIDADTLDGYDSTQFVKTSGNETIGGDKTFTNSINVQGNLQHNGIDVLDKNSSIKDLSDVSSTMTPNDGDVLKYNASSGVWESGAGGGGSGTDEKVKADSSDSTAGYLSDKVDNTTIEVDTTNHYLKVKDGVYLENAASYINNTFTEKTNPVDNDVILIEDSEDSYNKKKVKILNVGWGQRLVAPTVTSGDIQQNSSGTHTISNYDSTQTYVAHHSVEGIQRITIDGDTITITTEDLGLSGGASKQVSYVLSNYKTSYLQNYVIVTFNITPPPETYDQQADFSGANYNENNFDEINDGSVV